VPLGAAAPPGPYPGGIEFEVMCVPAEAWELEIATGKIALLDLEAEVARWGGHVTAAPGSHLSSQSTALPIRPLAARCCPDTPGHD
jgi:hypothetical protein